MDPDEVLRRARDACANVTRVLDQDDPLAFGLTGYAGDLADSFRALDEWLTMRGHKPADWK